VIEWFGSPMGMNLRFLLLVMISPSAPVSGRSRLLHRWCAKGSDFFIPLLLIRAFQSPILKEDFMKKLLLIATAVVGFTAATAFAEMGTGQGGGMMGGNWGWGMGYGWGFGLIIVILVVVGIVYMMKRK